jgi:hypothetical protein
MKLMGRWLAITTIATMGGVSGIVGASSAGAVPPPNQLSGSFNGSSTSSHETCGYHTVVSYPVTGQLSPGPKFQGVLSLDYCTQGGQPMGGSWLLDTKQGNGTLTGTFGGWSRSAVVPPPDPPLTTGCFFPIVDCVANLTIQMLPTAGSGVFTRFHGGLVNLSERTTTVSGSFPTVWGDSVEGTISGTLTR